MADEKTLRDEFAMAAMNGDWASSLGHFDHDGDDDHLLDRAALYYRMADAMLIQRRQGRGRVIGFPSDTPPEP
jgi:hypothetical protein